MKLAQSARRILDQSGVIKTHNHFVYASGKHGSSYVAKDLLYINPKNTSVVCGYMAHKIYCYCHKKLGIGKLVIVSPAVGGVALSQWVTYHLLVWGASDGFEASAAYAEKEQSIVTMPEHEFLKVNGKWEKIEKNMLVFIETGNFVIRRGYDKLVANSKVVVVEDILTTGKSAKATVEAVKKVGGEVVMVSAICNRGRVTAEALGVPHLEAVLDVKFEMFDPNDCPLCKKHVPISTEFGHGGEFMMSLLNRG